MKRLLIIFVMLTGLVGAALYVLWPQTNRGLVLYSAIDYGPEVAKAFKEKSGIDITIVDVSTGALLAKVSAEGHQPAWSMLWFDGDLAAAALDKAGLLARHSVPQGIPFNALGNALIPRDGSYTPTGLTLAGAFTYHRNAIPRPPTQWADLLASDFSGAVGMNNPAISGPTYPILAGMLQQAGGWPQGQGYVLGLKDNGLHVYAKNANTLAALRSNEIKLAVTQSSAAWFVAAKDPSLEVALPSPSFALPSVICVAPGLSRQQAAAVERFIRFAMSPEGQRLRMAQGEGDGYYWPLTSNVAPAHALPALSSLTIKRLDPAKWGPLEDRINAWFSKVVVGK